MTLYQRLTGADFDRLPPVLRAFHGSPNGGRATGRIAVTRGDGWLRGVATNLAGLPRAAESAPAELTVTVEGQAERWRRILNGTVLETIQWERDGRMWERVGPLDFISRVDADERGLTFRLERVMLYGLSLPGPLAPGGDGSALGEGDAWRVRTDIAAPLLGRLVRYEGLIRPEIAP